MTVNIVNVDVHVTDRRGRPVPDLTVADFELFEEGERVEIANFLNAAERHRDSAKKDSDLEWTEAAGGEDPGPPEPPMLVAVHIDRARMGLGSRRRIEQDLVSLMERLADQPRDTRFLLAVGDSGLDIRTAFTSDPLDLKTALERLHTDPPASVRDEERLHRQTLREIQTAYQACLEAQFCEPCGDMWANFLGSASQYASETRAQSTASLSILGELVTALGGMPGPKALIFVTGGLSQRPGSPIYHYLGELCPDRQTETDRLQMDQDDTTLFNRFSALSNANRVTIYPVDAAGIRTASSVDPSFGGPLNSLTADRVDFRPTAQNDRLRFDDLQTTLQLLADETGGRAVFNQPRASEALEDIAADFSAYYSLGYAASPRSRYPIRQIEVRLTTPRKGWRVRYRRSYVFKSDVQHLADRLFAALKIGEQSNPLGAAVHFGEASPVVGSKQLTLPVEVSVPTSSVTLLPGPEGTTGAVRVFLIAEHDDGRRTPMRQKTLTVDATELRALTVVGIHVDLPRGSYSVAVGIRDEATGRASYLVDDVDVVVPAP